VAADDVPAPIELTDLLGVKESARSDLIGRDEAVAAPPARLEMVRHRCVIRHSAVVDRDEERNVAHAGDGVEMRVEYLYGQLVAIRRVGREAALARILRVDVMKQQRYGGHGGFQGFGGRATSSADIR
jgi:hypothetical protein